MEKVSLDNVRIGVLDDNGKFVMSPIIGGPTIYFESFKSENLENIPKTEIFCYEISQYSISLFDSNGKGYLVNTFSNDYVKYLNRFSSNLTKLIGNSKKRNRPYGTIGPKIYDFEITIKGDIEVFLPPIKCLNLRASGNICGHKYLKNGFGITGKLAGVNYNDCIFSSKRTSYSILSLSIEYEEYLTDILFGIEIMLNKYSK